jgi:nucleoside-triphosphatase THEP1
MPEEIYIFSAAIKTGKTTRLLEFSSKHKDVYGILTPVLGGKRFFMDAHSKEQFLMESESGTVSVLHVGKFTFDAEAFKKASAIIRNGLKLKDGWLIIDEIGPLELNREGFYEVVNEIISKPSQLKILFVIRDSILHKAIEFFKMDSGHVHMIDNSSTILNE